MLLDTSGLFCYYHRNESQHADAVTFFKAAPTRLTHNYVLAEFVPLCQTRGLNRVEALTFAADLLDDPLVEVVWVDEAMHRSALVLLRRQIDKTYSLCDAVSFLLMEQYSLTEALTTDHHFEQAGFVRLLKP
ncbi:MAG: type II toxin-antitoxin system VapC family toxin [Blastocatellia bacterium]